MLRVVLAVLTVANLVACTGERGGTPKLADVQVTFESHRRGTVTFRLVKGGKGVARTVDLEIDLKHATGKCLLFGRAEVAAYVEPDMRATIPIMVRQRGGAGCPYGELKQPAITVSASSDGSPPFSTATLAVDKVVVPDNRPKPLPELDAEIQAIAAGLVDVEKVGTFEKVPVCKAEHVAEVDVTRPLEGVELDSLRLMADPNDLPESFSRMRSKLFVRISNYRKRRERTPDVLLADLRKQSHILIYAVRMDEAPSVVGGNVPEDVDGEFMPGMFLADALLVDVKARTPRCTFRVLAGNSKAIKRRKGANDLDRLASDLKHNIVEKLHAELAKLSPKLVPPDAPRLQGDDPAATPEEVEPFEATGSGGG